MEKEYGCLRLESPKGDIIVVVNKEKMHFFIIFIIKFYKSQALLDFDLRYSFFSLNYLLTGRV